MVQLLPAKQAGLEIGTNTIPTSTRIPLLAVYSGGSKIPIKCAGILAAVAIDIIVATIGCQY